MRRPGWFAAGLFTAPAIAIIAGVILLREAAGFSARRAPGAFERWAAQEARALALPGGVQTIRNPVPETPAVIQEATEHWADHCASCHANNGSGETVMGKGMYPPAPDMRLSATQERTDGELFFIIRNGIRITGMPAWGQPADPGEDSWKL